MTLRRVDATIFACWICDFNVDKEFSSWIVVDTAVLLTDDNEAFVDVVVAEGAVVEDDCPRNLPRDFGGEAASDFVDGEEEAAAAGAGAERNLPRRGAADPSVVVFGGAILVVIADVEEAISTILTSLSVFIPKKIRLRR